KEHRAFAHDRASSIDADSECATVFAHNLDVNFARLAHLDALLDQERSRRFRFGQSKNCASARHTQCFNGWLVESQASAQSHSSRAVTGGESVEVQTQWRQGGIRTRGT